MHASAHAFTLTPACAGLESDPSPHKLHWPLQGRSPRHGSQDLRLSKPQPPFAQMVKDIVRRRQFMFTAMLEFSSVSNANAAAAGEEEAVLDRRSAWTVALQRRSPSHGSQDLRLSKPQPPFAQMVKDIVHRRQFMFTVMLEFSSGSNAAAGEEEEEGAVLDGSSAWTVEVEKPSGRDGAGLEEALYVKMRLERDKALGFRVFVGLPSADAATPVSRAEFAGSFFHHAKPLRRGQPAPAYEEALFRVEIGGAIRRLGLLCHRTLLVTLVPIGPHLGFPVAVHHISIKLE